MKRTYIKPEIEELDSELTSILCVSDYDWGVDNGGGKGGSGQPAPDGAREFDGGFFEDEDF